MALRALADSLDMSRIPGNLAGLPGNSAKLRESAELGAARSVSNYHVPHRCDFPAADYIR